MCRYSLDLELQYVTKVFSLEIRESDSEAVGAFETSKILS